jgi:hypothetical protein
MSFRNRFSSRRPLPTISESPSTSSPSPSTIHPSTSPTTSAASTPHPSYVRSRSLPLVPKRLTGMGSTSGTSNNAAAAAGVLGGPKQPLVKQRTSKTSQKHVNLPTSVQDAPLPSLIDSLVVDDVTDDAGGDMAANESQNGGRISGEEILNERGRRWRQSPIDQSDQLQTDIGASQRTIGEQLTPEQRDEMGYQRLTAYYCCEEFKLGLLSTFLKREHAVSPRYPF